MANSSQKQKIKDSLKQEESEVVFFPKFQPSPQFPITMPSQKSEDEQSGKNEPL